MLTFSRSAILGGILLLAGCATPTQPSSNISFVGDPSSRPVYSPDARALQIAFAYNTDFRSGGMVGVEHDIERCYQQTAARSGNVAGLRDCMTLDYTAYNIDQVDGRQINGRSLPFFTDAAEKGRMAQYGPAAQFSSAAEMLSYLKDMHQLVNRHLVHDWKEQSGYCTKHATDADCTFLPTAQ